MRKSAAIPSAAAVVTAAAAAGTTQAAAADPASSRATRAIAAVKSHAALTKAGGAEGHRRPGRHHFYYLLAEGSGAKTTNGVAHNSPTCNSAQVTGIGRTAAQKFWYRALTVYMTSSTTYRCARTATLNAAKDLYGASSTQYNTVAAAWSAVAVS